MIRVFALVLAAVTLLAGAGQARAQGFGFDRPDIIGGPNFSIGGSNLQVSIDGQMAGAVLPAALS